MIDLEALRAVPLISLSIFLPLLGAVLIWLVPAERARRLAALVMGLSLLLSLLVLLAFDRKDGGFQLIERLPWVASLNVEYLVAVDGLSVLFLPSTALLFLGALVASWHWVVAGQRFYYSLLLLFQSATLGIFCALDLMLFFLFWELTLVPIYFLLGRWGVVAGSSKVAARYVLIMLAAGVPLLLAVVLVATQGPALNFDLMALREQPMGEVHQQLFVLLCLLGFAFKVPLVPFHTWLPQVALAAPGALTALLIGLKLGAYGLIRIAVPLAPAAAQDLHWLFAGLGTVSLIYGAVGMLAQSNLRVMLASASICHVGLVLIGIASFAPAGIHGAVSLLLSFSVASGGAMLLLEFLRQRTGSTDIHALGGVAKTMPLLAIGFMICGLAGVGMPGTSSFPGEFLLIMTALDTHTGAGMAALFGLAIAAGGFLAGYRAAFFGLATRPAVLQAADLGRREQIVLLIIILLALGIGIYPAPWLDIVRTATEAWAVSLRR
jgi:NADH-quinone oxidoreductase subunit M